MKLWTLLALFSALALPSNAWSANAIIDCASTNIATSYSTSNPSLPTTLKQVPLPSKASLAVINNTAFRICVNTVTSSISVAPTAGNGNEHCVAAMMFAFYDNLNFAGSSTTNVYVRADASACTSGTVDIDLW